MWISSRALACCVYRSKSRTPIRAPRLARLPKVYDYLRLLYARAGTQYCPVCGERIEAQSAEKIVDRLLRLEEALPFRFLLQWFADARENTLTFPATRR